MYNYDSETIVSEVETYLQNNPIDLTFNIDANSIISQLNDVIAQNPIKLSFDESVIDTFLLSVRTKFEALELDAKISVDDKSWFDYLTGSIGGVADLFSLFKKDDAVISIKNFNKICSEGKVNVGAYARSLDGISVALEAVSRNSKNFKQNTKQLYDVFEKIGKNIGDGIIKGIKGNTLQIDETIQETANGIAKTVKRTMKISSPSKVMQELGSFISEGLGDGIEKGAKFAEDAAKALCDNCEDEFDDLSDATDKLNGKEISFGGGLAAVAALATGIVAIFSNLMENNEEFSAKMQEVWGAVQEAFQPVVDMLASFFENFILGSETTGGAMDTVMEILTVASEFICGVISAITQFWNENGHAIMAKIQEIFDYLMPVVEGIKTFVGGLFEFIMGIFTGDTEAIQNGCSALWEGIKQIFTPIIEFFAHIFSKAWEGIKNAFSTVGEFFSGIWNTIKEIFTTIGHSIADGISGAFKATVNAVINFAESIINGFIRGINGAIEMINKLPGVRVGLISTLSIPRLEFGGLVTPGQIFVAREAGPELVGSFGGYTAVMNNNQIVESVSNAVYKAQREQNALLREQNALLQQLLNSTSDVTMKVGETQFAKVTVKAINNLARRQGRVYLNI